jgi:predicted HTH domain antitoxin
VISLAVYPKTEVKFPRSKDRGPVERLAIAALLKHCGSMELLLDVPEEVLQAVQTPGSDPAEAVLRELVLALFQRGSLSAGRSAKILGLARREFHELLKERQVTLPLDLADFESELARLPETSK